MTNRIADTFAALRRAKKKALVAYLCMGYPTLAESIELAVAAANAGADILELGVPFSDPTADGPTIARASERAIRGGATIARVIEAAAAIRARIDAPLVLFTYYNPVLVTGEARIVELARAAGIDGMLLVDLPPEEAGDLRRSAAAAGIAAVPLIAPTTGPARVDAILRAASEAGGPPGFLYYVSMTGITGAHAAHLEEARARAAELREKSGWPIVVGFGIDSAARAIEAAGGADDGPDGIVIGTALVRRIEEAPTAEERATAVTGFVRELRAALG